MWQLHSQRLIHTSSSQTLTIDQLSSGDFVCRPKFCAHTGLDIPDVPEAEALSIFHYSSSPWPPSKMLLWGWLPKSAGRKRKSLGLFFPSCVSISSSSCNREYSQKLSQHPPYLIPTSLVHLHDWLDTEDNQHHYELALSISTVPAI